MCGIAGCWGGGGWHVARVNGLAMATALAHRGPDGEGVWCDRQAGLALAHRRLAILDLSTAGAQPMSSACGRYVLVFNGEIYNHHELRAQLEQADGARWRGHSDTEVLLAAVAAWGLERALGRANGMFALALWDRGARVLSLARDRLGEKPLYYGRVNGVFLFGSELKALCAHDAWHGEVDPEALTLFMRHGYVPAPWSIYRGVRKLPPGQMVQVKNGEAGEPFAYWDFAAVANAGLAAPLADASELIDETERRLQAAVALRMEADVPLGAFLSGGIDSSLVVALMQRHASQPVRTFTIGFRNKGFDEAPHARRVAQHLGTMHTEFYVGEAEMLASVPELGAVWDEPFADSSQIPTLLVSRLARRHVTVVLSGDGGDELFAGYSRYFLFQRLWRALRRTPRGMRRGLAWGGGLATRAAIAAWGRSAGAAPRAWDRLDKLWPLLEAGSGEELYRCMISAWKRPATLVREGAEPARGGGGLEEITDLMRLDGVTYLPDDILVKVDRASMAVGLEARAPLLDHTLVEFAWRLPMAMKVRGGTGKWVLRQVLGRHLPRELIDRPKQGFEPPMEHWLRGPLREWGEALLDPGRLRAEGYLDPVPVQRLWGEHQSRRRRWHAPLWHVLMFQAWLERRQRAAPAADEMPLRVGEGR